MMIEHDVTGVYDRIAECTYLRPTRVVGTCVVYAYVSDNDGHERQVSLAEHVRKAILRREQCQQRS